MLFFSPAMDITSDVSKNTYIERAGTAAGALYNRSPDNRNAGLNMAFVNPGTENIGNENGLESEPILMNGGVDIKNLYQKALLNQYVGYYQKNMQKNLINDIWVLNTGWKKAHVGWNL